MKKNAPAASPLRAANVDAQLDSYSARLAKYSAAATVVIALAPAAGAQIHNITTFNISGAGFSSTVPTLTGIGAPLLSFVAGTAAYAAGFSGGFRFGTSVTGWIRGHIFARNSFRSAVEFGVGVPIPGSRVLITGASATGAAFQNLGTHVGYIGFKTTQRGYQYYGWLRFSVSGALYNNTFTFVDHNGDGIYGAFAMGGINAGDVAAIPEPATVATGLSLFALGAAGVREHRRRQKLAA